MPRLSVATTTHGVPGHPDKTVAVVQLQGFIDAANYRSFEKALEEAARTGAPFLLLDFSRVQYINSTGMSALIRHFEQAKSRGGALCLCGVSRTVGLSMHLLGLTSLIYFAPDLRAAHEHLLQVAEGKAQAQPPSAPAGTPRKVAVRRALPRLPQGAKVLVVTPSAGRFTRVLRLHFKDLNGSYHLVHDAREALSKFGELDPDLVVVDDRCDPRGEFVGRVKLRRESSLTSIIKIYAKHRDVESEVDFKIWENDYLVDPFDTLEFFSLTDAELLRVPRDRKVFIQQVHFEFKTAPRNVEKAYKLSEAILQDAMPDREEAMALHAAVKEGVDNAVVHGNRWLADRTVDVNFLVDRRKVTVIVEDEGKGFDYEYYLARIDRDEAFEEAKRRIIEGARGGLGILLMSRCTDRIDYSGAGNVLRLEKNL